MTMIVDYEKTFEYFSNLFPEIRQCIVDEMEPMDRIRLTRCSKRSKKEAVNSKNYIYGLGILSESSTHLYIQVQHGETRRFRTIIGFVMRFREIDGKKFMICESSEETELWKEKLDESTDLVEYAVDYFKSLMKKYQNRIKNATFDGDLIKDYDFEIDSMRRLEHLSIVSNWNIQKYFSKLRQPLKSLLIYGEIENQDLANFEQIYQVREKLITFQKYSYEQMLRLSAPSFIIKIGNLTENMIFTIIRSWQNGTDNRNDGWKVWRLDDSSFSVAELLRLLGVPHDGLEETTSYRFEIKHDKEVGKMAELTYQNGVSEKCFVFDTCQLRRDRQNT